MRRSIPGGSVTEQNVENYAVFCRQKDNRTCERAPIKNATLPYNKGRSRSRCTTFVRCFACAKQPRLPVTGLIRAVVLSKKSPFPIADINKLHHLHLLCGIFTVVRSLQKQFALAFCLAVIDQIIHQLVLFGK